MAAPTLNSRLRTALRHRLDRFRRDPSVAQELAELQSVVRGLRSTVAEMSSNLVDMSRTACGDADERIVRLAQLLVPYELPGQKLVRVGAAGDGGYIMVADLEADGALSIGVGGDISWDAAIAATGVPVAAFDPTVSGLPIHCAGVAFFPIGVTGLEDQGPDYRTLPELAALAGFGAGDELLLKMDVEGAEWDSLAVLTDSERGRFRQIVLELHDLHRAGDSVAGESLLGVIQSLRETHVPVHIHANNWGRLARFNNLWFPDVLEVSFIRSDLAPESRPRAHIRLPIDAPCDPSVAEFDLEGLLRTPS